MTIGIVGYGHFGTFLHTLITRFAPEVMVKIYAPERVIDNTLFFSLAEVARCDIIVLCVPISTFEQVVTGLVSLLGNGSIVVDISTVKMHTTQILRTHLAGRLYVAAHPMFGPESYGKTGGNVTGFRIIVTESTLPQERYDIWRTFIEHLGFSIVTMSPEEHDEHLARSLFLTHYIGQIIAHAGFTRTEIDTVSFGFLMSAVESVQNDTALFKDVYTYDPYCEAVLKQFDSAEAQIYAILRE